MSIHIYFSNNSIRDTALSCDSLGIHYTVSHTDTITSVTRWNSETYTNVLVGQFELFFFKNDRIRFGQDGNWQLARTFLVKGEGDLISTARSFKANDGVEYRWKGRWGQLIMTRDSDNNGEPLITYHRNQFSTERAYLEVVDSSVLAGLDYIILAFLIREKKRRDRQKYRQHGASGGR